jgi:transcriptional regulator with GAF, ATPase, and Fis domain
VREFINKIGGTEDFDLPKDAMDILLAHDWPGNVRELRNVLERGVYLSKQMGDEAFKFINISGLGAPRPSNSSDLQMTFNPNLSYRANKEIWNDMFERRYLTWLLARAEGNISRAAREADMDRKYLHKLIKKHKIEV